MYYASFQLFWYSWDHNFISILCRVLPIVVFQSAKILQQAVFMVCYFVLPFIIRLKQVVYLLSASYYIAFGIINVTEFFLRQFCDAHTCTGNQKPFSRGRKVLKRLSIRFIYFCSSWMLIYVTIVLSHAFIFILYSIFSIFSFL